MSMKSMKDFIGFSAIGIKEALEHALQQAGNPGEFAVIETLGSQGTQTTRLYQVMLKALSD